MPRRQVNPGWKNRKPIKTNEMKNIFCLQYRKKKRKKAYCKEMTFSQYSDLIDFERNTFENKVKSTKINNLFKGGKKKKKKKKEESKHSTKFT